MATKSILKTVRIKSSKSAIALVNALENAKNKSAKEVKLSKPYSEASEEEILQMFEKNHDRI